MTYLFALNLFSLIQKIIDGNIGNKYRDNFVMCETMMRNTADYFSLTENG